MALGKEFKKNKINFIECLGRRTRQRLFLKKIIKNNFAKCVMQVYSTKFFFKKKLSARLAALGKV